MTTDPNVLAHALAGAFLAGAWTPEEMADRGRYALATKRPWVTRLALATWRAWPTRPDDRPRDVAEFIAWHDELFDAMSAALNRGETIRVRHWMTAPLMMGPSRWPVPRIDDRGALGRWLGLTVGELDWFADRRSWERTAPDEPLRHYTRRWLQTSHGSIRLLEAPKRRTKALQREILHGIIDAIPTHDAAHGFRPGRSVRTGAAVHCGTDVVIRLDLESFFASISAGRVYGILRAAGYADTVAHTLAALCTTVTPPPVLGAAPQLGTLRFEQRRRLLHRLREPHLPQGSPTSPALANLAAFALDRRLSGLAEACGAHYTRYADDLVLSGPRRLARTSDRLVALIGEIVHDEGFRLNDTKTRVLTSAMRQQVTGLVVNHHVSVPRADYDRLRAVLHDAATHGPAAANRDGRRDFRAHLLGRIAWVGADHPTRARRLSVAFEAIEW